MANKNKSLMAQRFRGFLPVVVDVETGGTDPKKDALLEIGVVTLKMTDDNQLELDEHKHYHIEPFKSANIDPKALELNRIKPEHPFRFAISEHDALKQMFAFIKPKLKETGCTRAVLVGHNAWFDLHFVKAAVVRTEIKHDPFHAFTSFDTATLSALAFGQTVLAQGLKHAKIDFDEREAHSALYDALKTAELFCRIINHYPLLSASGGQ